MTDIEVVLILFILFGAAQLLQALWTYDITRRIEELNQRKVEKERKP